MIQAVVPGMTREQYNGMSETMLVEIRKHRGFLAHTGISIPGGIQVVELWESQEAFDKWIQGTVMPASKAAGLPPPIITILPAERVELR
jgi:heme-degrading monooxygenase HmoA